MSRLQRFAAPADSQLFEIPATLGNWLRRAPQSWQIRQNLQTHDEESATQRVMVPGGWTSEAICQSREFSINHFIHLWAFLMSRKVYVAGKLVPAEQATVSVFDHGLLYGDGIFEGIRVYGGRVFLHREHIDRLFESALAIRLEIPITHAEMIKAVEDTVKANDIMDGYVRLVVTRGSGSLGLDIRRTSNPQVIIIADTISLYPAELYETGMKLVTAATIRNHPGALSPRIKSLNYLNNIMAKIEGTDAGTVEALMLNHNGEVAECTGDNIFVVKQGVLKTPQRDSGILEGITRNAVMKLAVEAGVIVQECVLTRHDIFTADECFLTGTAAEVIAVISLDGRKIGAGTPGPVTTDLLKRFRKLTQV